MSVSKLKNITKCGRAFELERIEKKPSRPAFWTVRGIAVHSVIESWEASKRSIDPLQFLEQDAWPQAFERTLQDYPELDKWQKTPNVRSVEQDGKLRLRDAVKQVETYCERAVEEEDIWRVKETELKFKLEFSEFVINGIIDQAIEWQDGDITLRDVKTGGDDQEDNRQLGVYRQGYLLMTGRDVQYSDYWYTKLDRPSDPIDLSPYTLEYIEAEFKKLDQIIKNKLFLANPSKKNCFGCGVAEFCTESKQK